MKIGIFAFRQAPYISANTAIAYTIGEELSKEHQVVYIGRKQAENQNNVLLYHGSSIRHLNDQPKPEWTRTQNYLMRFNQYRIALSADIRALRRIVREESIDAIVCITAPNENAMIVALSNLSIPIVLLQLDPFYNGMDQENPRLKKQFCRLARRFRHVFTTDLLIETYRAEPKLAKVINRFSVAQFPKLIRPVIDSEKTVGKERILLYTGSLYSGIRNPDIMIRLQFVLPEHCQLVFCGGCDRKEDYMKLAAAGIRCMGYLPQERLATVVSKADCLLNIGNAVRNQLGSKLIDYLATGKPILNLYQLEDCPTKHVLKNYGNHLDIAVETIEESGNRISDFLKFSAGKTLPWEEIEQNYRMYTPEFVAEQILETIQ